MDGEKDETNIFDYLHNCLGSKYLGYKIIIDLKSVSIQSYKTTITHITIFRQNPHLSRKNTLNNPTTGSQNLQNEVNSD